VPEHVALEELAVAGRELKGLAGAKRVEPAVLASVRSPPLREALAAK
jgi:hypothetical protein